MRALLIALIVGLIAYGAGYFHGRRTSPPPVALVAEPPRPPPAAEVAPSPPPPSSVDVELIGSGGRRVGAVTGLALGPLRRVVLPLAALLERIGAAIPAVERFASDDVATQVRESLGEAPFAAAWETGWALPPQQIVVEVLAAADPPDPMVTLPS